MNEETEEEKKDSENPNARAVPVSEVVKQVGPRIRPRRKCCGN
jgi:hypothetical protein